MQITDELDKEKMCYFLLFKVTHWQQLDFIGVSLW